MSYRNNKILKACQCISTTKLQKGHETSSLSCSSQGMEPDLHWPTCTTKRNRCYKCIVTVVDYNSKFVEGEPLKQQESHKASGTDERDYYVIVMLIPNMANVIVWHTIFI